MTAILDIVEWCRQERQRAAKQYSALETARCKIAEDKGHGWVDQTSEHMAKLKLHLTALDELLQAYEAEHAGSERTEIFISESVVVSAREG